jgi:hypothetical protein
MEQDNNNSHVVVTNIHNRLDQIGHFLEGDIQQLKIELQAKDMLIEELKEALTNAQLANEGNRQLINKLLGESGKLQNDIEWYKRTYEQRSFLGTVKEKIFTKKRNKKS